MIARACRIQIKCSQVGFGLVWKRSAKQNSGPGVFRRNCFQSYSILPASRRGFLPFDGRTQSSHPGKSSKIKESSSYQNSLITGLLWPEGSQNQKWFGKNGVCGTVHYNSYCNVEADGGVARYAVSIP